jgi:hypothetical protein
MKPSVTYRHFEISISHLFALFRFAVWTAAREAPPAPAAAAAAAAARPRGRNIIYVRSSTACFPFATRLLQDLFDFATQKKERGT